MRCCIRCAKSAPVGKSMSSSSGRQSCATMSHNMSCCERWSTITSYIAGPSLSSRSASRVRSRRIRRAQLFPAARSSTVASKPSWRRHPGTPTLRTDGVPSASVASTTKAACPPRIVAPIVSDQSRAKESRTDGRPSSHAACPSASALLRTSSGTSSGTWLVYPQLGSAAVWGRLLDAHGAVIMRVEYDPHEQAIVASVRLRARDQDRCGVCQIRCPRYDPGRGPRRWRTSDLGTTRAFLQAHTPGSAARNTGWWSSRCPGPATTPDTPARSMTPLPGWPPPPPRPE